MDKLHFRGSWNQVAGKLKKQFGNLTDDDVMYSEGQEDELLGRLETKLGRSRDEVRTIIENL